MPWTRSRESSSGTTILGMVSKANEGVSLQGDLFLRDGTVCFIGGTMCPTASYDQKTGELRSKIVGGERTLFYPYFPEYGSILP